MPEPGAPALRTRSAPAAFGRGVSQVVANPRLLFAPLAFGGALTAVVVAAGAGIVLGAGGVIASSEESLRRGPEGFSDFVEGLRSAVLASPAAVLLALLAVLAALLLLTVLAAWVRAGVTGSLAEIDARAGEGASLDAFRHPALGPAFFASASRLFKPFFALVNLYALVASFVVLLLVAPLAVAFVAAASGRSGLAVLSAVFFAVSVLAAVVLSIGMRLVYLVAGRVLATEGLDALAATGRAIALVKASLGRSLTLYFLTVGGALAVGLAFVFPRVVLTMAAGWAGAGALPVLAVSAFFVVVQAGAALAYELAVTGAFVALWPADAAPEPAAP